MKNIFLFPIFAGNLCVAENNAVICNVTNKGFVRIQSCKFKHKIITHVNIPFLRGLEFLIFATFYYFWGLHKSFLHFNEKIVYKKQSYNSINSYYFSGIIILFALLIAIIILGIVPTYLGFWILSSSYSLFVKNLCIGITKCIVFYLVVLAIFKLLPLKMLAKFNSAGNVVLNNYDVPYKNHRATNYLNVVISSLLLTYFVISLLGLNLAFGWKILVNIGILILNFLIVFEFMNLLDTKWKSWKFLILITSVLINLSPSKTELQVASGAFNEGILMMENNEREAINNNQDNAIAFSLIFANVKEQLINNGIDEYGEAEWLIANVLNKKKLDLKFIQTVTKQQSKDIQKAVDKRIKGEPLAKIFGYTEFYGLKFKVNKFVLTPRQETELLVEKVIKTIKNDKVNILDLCTGSGVIAIALAKNTNANIFATDISLEALDVAKFNAESNGVKVTFKQSDLFDKIKKRIVFDVIVSNPPYIKTDEIETLQKEVRDFDPHIALDGGIDGLYFYKKIIEEAPKHLTNKGKIMLEIGINQANKIKNLLTESFKNIKIIKDYNQVQRIIVAEKK